MGEDELSLDRLSFEQLERLAVHMMELIARSPQLQRAYQDGRLPVLDEVLGRSNPVNRPGAQNPFGPPAQHDPRAERRLAEEKWTRGAVESAPGGSVQEGVRMTGWEEIVHVPTLPEQGEAQGQGQARGDSLPLPDSPLPPPERQRSDGPTFRYPQAGLLPSSQSHEVLHVLTTDNRVDLGARPASTGAGPSLTPSPLASPSLTPSPLASPSPTPSPIPTPSPPASPAPNTSQAAGRGPRR